MEIETKYSGVVELASERVIDFVKGLPAFEEEKQFVLLPFEEGTPFYVLQSTKTKDIAFLMINPFQFVSGYEVKLPDTTVEQLEIESEEEVATFVLLTVHEPFEATTANLQGPIIINAAKQKGKQLLLSTSDYGTKHTIFQQTVKGEV
ncbi:flagellar assembly protein FliW [Bacillus sp. FJAT-45037]|uniref:flagellar assembly protein FliW n=1 Tax=Bacillus sp. FJAT-45037 TaxID=2011007 RepID=UPI000C2481CD|nr:flagellar assembly protein FliW [Bacillus sp. FJAT-45037]